MDADVRAVYTGFAEGVNRYIVLHADSLPAWVQPVFTGPDVLAGEVTLPNPFSQRSLLMRLKLVPDTLSRAARDLPPWQHHWPTSASSAVASQTPHGSRDGLSARPEPGSNAWALAPSRTKDGAAILLRNPHLSWNAGYYEAHVVVPGVLEWYGDFRIGGPFDIVGGFNRRLGFATTNNPRADRNEVYALAVDPAHTDHVLFNGASVPLRRREVTVEFRNGPGYDTETRAFWTTPIGPAIWRANGKVYVLKDAAAGNYRNGQQLLRMMQAQNLDQWKDAMRMRGRTTSNFTYADADGNIFYVWNASVPALPRPWGGDTTAVDATTSSDVWSHLIPWDSLPHFENPPGGYVLNSNDPPYFANLNTILDRRSFPDNCPAPAFGLRSQLSVDLIGHHDTLSLQDVIRRKFSTRMLLADRVKADLVKAVEASHPSDE
ncbi:MAG: penicillin acylase family protein, partial [Gemmatimonadota bacterium]